MIKICEYLGDMNTYDKDMMVMKCDVNFYDPYQK